MKKTSNKNLSNVIIADRKVFGAFFFGFGLCMLLINISTVITLIPHVKAAGIPMSEFLRGYYLSFTSSIIIIGMALYNYSLIKKNDN